MNDLKRVLTDSQLDRLHHLAELLAESRATKDEQKEFHSIKSTARIKLLKQNQQQQDFTSTTLVLG